MFFIHDTTCISAQQTFDEAFLKKDENDLNQPTDNILFAIEPAYEGIPPGILRRMGRAVRLGVGAAMPVLSKQEEKIDGIIIGTSMGGMEDCVKFLNQVIEYNEGSLTPTNFVQSTPNAIAGQLGLLKKNTGYNITHVHRGFSFENAMIDAGMKLREYPSHSYLLGAVDEISNCNYNIERLDGWYKTDATRTSNLYESRTNGSIAGEGAAMFIVNNDAKGATAEIKAVEIFHTEDPAIVSERLRNFLSKHLDANKSTILLSGENGDERFRHFYESCEQILGNNVSVARFKHISGEHPTASGFGVWLACKILTGIEIPAHLLKTRNEKIPEQLLIYNNYKGIQHSFMLLEKK